MGNWKSEILGTLEPLQPANIEHNHMTGDWNSISHRHKAFLIG